MDPNSIGTQATQTAQKITETGIQHFINNASSYALKIIGAIAAFFLMMIIAGFISRAVRKAIIKSNTGTDEQAKKIGKLIGNIVYYILLGFAIFVGFEILGFDIGLLLGGVSFGIGLAFKEILGNMIGGIMILYTKEFKLGDIIEVQADENYFGRIEEITIRYTIIRTLDLRQAIIPNLKMISVPIKTFSAEPIIKLSTKISVHYDTDIEKAIEIIKNTVNSLNFVKEKDNTSIFVINFADSSIDLAIKFFFDPNSRILADYAIGLINEVVAKSLTENNIIIPYPHRTIKFESEQDKKNMIQKINNIKNL